MDVTAHSRRVSLPNHKPYDTWYARYAWSWKKHSAFRDTYVNKVYVWSDWFFNPPRKNYMSRYWRDNYRPLRTWYGLRIKYSWTAR